MWDLARINYDNALITEFGLKNMKELWKVQTELSRLRRNVRLLLSGSSPQYEMMKEKMLNRLSRYGIAQKTSTLDDLLDIKETAYLSRRLQSIVHKKGLAKTMKQARQLITHGYIQINGKKVNRPGYLVDVEEEKGIGYYKPIDINVKPKENMPEAPSPAPSAPAKEEAKAE